MTERERLIAILDRSPAHFCDICHESPEVRAESIEKLADHLLAAIVRCKFCKYGETVTCPITGTKSLFCTYNTKPIAVDTIDYCSRGERREK